MDTRLLEELKQEYEALLDAGRVGDALPLIRQAAHWADIDSQILAERIYLHGSYSHPISLPAGYEYARLAAMNGDVISMADLGFLYGDDRFDQKDLKKSFYWLSKAAQAGSQDVLDALGMLYLQGRGTERNIEYALSCFERAAAASTDEKIHKHLQMARRKKELEQKRKDERGI